MWVTMKSLDRATVEPPYPSILPTSNSENTHRVWNLGGIWPYVTVGCIKVNINTRVFKAVKSAISGIHLFGAWLCTESFLTEQTWAS